MLKELSAVILAGRDNRHLKSTKQTLPFGDETVLTRTLQAYLDAGVAEVILVLSERQAELQGALGALAGRVKVLTVADSEVGLGACLREGVRSVAGGSKGFMIGVADQPLLTAELITAMAEAFAKGGKKIALPVVQGGIGFPAIFDASMSKEFGRLKDAEESWDVVTANATEVVDVHRYETAYVRSIDDMDDYFAMLDLARLPRPDLTPPKDEPESSLAGAGSADRNPLG